MDSINSIIRKISIKTYKILPESLHERFWYLDSYNSILYSSIRYLENSDDEPQHKRSCEPSPTNKAREKEVSRLNYTEGKAREKEVSRSNYTEDKTKEKEVSCSNYMEGKTEEKEVSRSNHTEGVLIFYNFS